MSTCKSKNLIFCLVTALASTALSFTSNFSSLADNWGQKQAKLKNRDNPEFSSTRLTQAMAVPGFPDYPGKRQFVTGTLFPNAKGGQSLTMQFYVKEAPQTVMEWYQSQLSKDGWVSQPLMSSKTMVAAMRNNDLCQVMVQPPTRVGVGCNLIFRYKFYKPTDFTAEENADKARR